MSTVKVKNEAEVRGFYKLATLVDKLEGYHLHCTGKMPKTKYKYKAPQVTKMPSVAAGGSGSAVKASSRGRDQILLAKLERSMTGPAAGQTQKMGDPMKGKKMGKAERDKQEKVKILAMKQKEEFVHVQLGLHELDNKMVSTQGLTREVLKEYEYALSNYIE